MRRTLDGNETARLPAHDDGTVDVVVQVDRLSVGAFALEVSLLLRSMSDELLFPCEGDVVIVSLCKDQGLSTMAQGASQFEVRLLPRDLEFMESYLLKYYRDGRAEVDHIDIDLYAPYSGVEVGTLILRAGDSAPGMTAEEAMRILGIG